MANYGVITWNEEDLVSSKNAVVMLANRYGVDVVFELEEDGEFGNLDVSSVLEEAGFIADDEKEPDVIQAPRLGDNEMDWFEFSAETGLYHWHGQTNYCGYTAEELESR